MNHAELSNQVRNMKVLCVEDNDVEFAYLAENFRTSAFSSPDLAFELDRATSGGAALQSVRQKRYDLIILDFGLGQESEVAGISLLKELYTMVPQVPLVAIVGSREDVLTMRAVREGIASYVSKDEINPRALMRAMTMALARTMQVPDFGRGAKGSEEGSPAGYPLPPLSHRDADQFSAFVERYRSALEEALEQKAYKVQNRVVGRLDELANDLGRDRASPRDVIEIHTSALKGVLNDESPERNAAYGTEARMLLLELMGHLAAYYRRQTP